MLGERQAFKPTLLYSMMLAAFSAAGAMPCAAYAEGEAAPAAPVVVAQGTPASTATTATSVATPPQRATQLETVVVTAQRRSENLQKEALAVSAVAGESIEKANIVDIGGLNGYVPGLLAEKSSGSEMMISIRGIGSETPQNLYTQPGVSVFVDGLYVPTALGVQQGFLDLARVEVLRGPQGTLFGQSSTGGAISIVSVQPQLGVFSGDISTSVGNYGLNREFVGINVPLGETVALRAAFQHQAHDGFAKNSYFPGYRLDEQDEDNGKISLLWKPTADLSATFFARYYKEDENGAEQKNVLDPIADKRRVSQDTPSFIDMRYQMYGASLQYDLPGITIKSVTGFQKMNNNQAIDDDRLDSATFGGYDAQPKWTSRGKTFTQEFNVLSNTSGPLSWIGGIFFINNKTNQYIAEFRDAGPAPANFFIPPPTGPSPDNVAYEEYSKITRDTYAPFVQATYSLTDTLRLTGGARYNHDEYKGRASFYYSPLAKVPSYSAGEWTGKTALEYDVSPDSLAYVSWTRGYKPGGINNAYDGSSVLVEQSFKTETVDSFEIGSKNDFLDHTARVNAAAFYGIYKNQQYLSSDPFPYQDGTANIPKSRIWGAELEGAWLAMNHHLRLGGNVTWLGGRIDDDKFILDAQSAATARAAYEASNPGAGDFDPGTIAAVAAAAQNSKGKKPPKLPNWTGALNAAYTMELGAAGSVTPRVEYVYRGKFVYRVFNSSALDTVGSYNTYNAYLDYVPPVDNLRFTLAVTNIGNKDGISGRFTDPYGSGQTSDQFIAPRQVVLTANYSF
ncbi:TonB-dependent receptor [soil metagenome]